MAVLVATVDGYHVLTSSGEHHVALAGHHVAALTPGPAGTWIAIVDQHEIWQHGDDGEWRVLAASELELVCLVSIGDVVFAGTVGPHMLRLDEAGTLSPLAGFETVPGRDEWHQVGSSLQVRSLTATADGAALLANVHVGGIARSEDAGRSWQPTLAVDDDVHEVKAHPTHREVVVAAAAVGLCVSRDAGRHWELVVDGLHATYARAVAFDGDLVLVSVSDGPFAKRAAIYRGRFDGEAQPGRSRLERVADGLPEWLDGNIDTRCLAARAGRGALADGSGSVWVLGSGTDGWSLAATGLPHVNAVALV
jgi:hypothetical protein